MRVSSLKQLVELAEDLRETLKERMRNELGHARIITNVLDLFPEAAENRLFRLNLLGVHRQFWDLRDEMEKDAAKIDRMLAALDPKPKRKRKR